MRAAAQRPEPSWRGRVGIQTLRRLGWRWVVPLVAFGLVLLSGPRAMTLEVQGTTLFASGPVIDDLPKFVDAFAAHPGIDTVVFVNSPGGDLWTGLAVGRFIAARQLRTGVAGRCESACSLMFIAGRERRFSDAMRPARTWVGIHGAHIRESRTVNTQISPQLREFYRTHMGDRFNERVIEQALNEMDDASAMLRVPDHSRPGPRVTHHCRSGTLPYARCTQMPQWNALNLGIVTHQEPLRVDLPPPFRERIVVAGTEFKNEMSDAHVYLAELAEARCGDNAACRTELANLAGQAPLRALATSATDKGLGWVSGRETAVQAMLGALYRCNHPRQAPARLCDLEWIADLDARPTLAALKAEHAAARTRIVVPEQEHHANEEFRGDVNVPPELRTQALTDLTPRSVAGIRTYSTQALARALRSPEAPVLIDVMAADASLPGAQVLVYGGFAFADARRETLYAQRFGGLLAAMAPERDRPVVFYCGSRNCWQSLNAAIRALKAGYTQVGWYRGGLEAWTAAGLPLVPPWIQAVAN